MPISQARYTDGRETRRDPIRKKRDFENLLEAERRYVKLVEAFSAGQTPAVVAAVRSFPQQYLAEYKGTRLAYSISSMDVVSDFQATIATNKLNQVILEEQCIMGN